MIDFSALAHVVPVFLLALISPGPDFMIVSSLSLAHGKRDGIMAAFGISNIIALYSVLSLTGMSALFARYVWLIAAIKICGGLYLIYMGVMLWRAGGKDSGDTAQPAKRRNAYATGVLTCLTNPKAIAFFASIFALGLQADTNTATKIALGTLPPVATFIWFALVATGLAQPKIRTRYLRWRGVFNRVAGSILALFGMRLVWGAQG